MCQGSDLPAVLPAPCSMPRVVLHYPVLSSGSLLGPIQCPVKHNYYSMHIFFFPFKAVKYGEHQGTSYSVKPRVCAVGTQGQREGVLGVLKLTGLVMGNCVGGRGGSPCCSKSSPWCEWFPQPHWGIARAFKEDFP